MLSLRNLTDLWLRKIFRPSSRSPSPPSPLPQGAEGRISVLVLGALILSVLQAPAQSGTPSRAAAQGRKQFESSCAFCHGTDATGGRGPDLVRSKLVADDQNGNLIGPVIRNGRPTKGMPAFNMPAEQITDIVAFLHSRQLAEMNSRTMGNGGAYALSRLLTGDASQGRTYFNGPGGCSGCHSVTGDLAHIASRYKPLQIELRMLYPRGEKPTVTVTLPSGKRITGKLEHIDEFSVALKDASGWNRSFARNEVKVAVHDPLAAHQELLNRLTQDEMHNLFAYLETLK